LFVGFKKINIINIINQKKGYKMKKNNKRFFKGVEILDPNFNLNLPFDNDAEKIAEIKMSNEYFTEKNDTTPQGMDAIDHLINRQLLDDAMNG